MKKGFFTLFLISLVVHSNLKAQFTFQNIALLSNWNNPSTPAEPTYGIKYNGIWGWEGNGNEYAIIGSSDGYYFINVTNPVAPVVCDFVAGVRDSCIWREIKTYSHYAYLISDDSPPNSFQIVDLQYLPDSVHVVHNSTSIFSRAHTLWVDGNKLYCASVKGGQFMNMASMAVFSLANPEAPVLLRKLNDDFPLPGGAVHDMLVKNDTVYASAGFDGLFVFKYDAIANQFIYINSLTTYPSQGYNHSSAITEDSRTLIFMDEVPDGLAVKSMDVTNLSNLSVNTTFVSNAGATPHNPFIVGNTCYIAYYQDGLYVYDVSDVNNPVQLGYFDTYNNPQGTYLVPAYKGAWGAYPFLSSGNILVSDMQSGLFVLDVSATQSVKEVNNQNAFTVFPNPAVSGEEVNYSFNKSMNGNFTLLDNTGRFISAFKVESKKAGSLNIPSLQNGLYTLQFIAEDGAKSTKKLVISKN